MNVISGYFWLLFEHCELSIPSVVLDGIRFPSLNGQSSSPVVGSVEDDSHCMSFAQVCMANTQIQTTFLIREIHHITEVLMLQHKYLTWSSCVLYRC